jgi:hypothetical protein
MKKLLLLLLCVPLMFSCGEKKEVNISKIDDVCELLNQVEIVTDNMIDWVERNGRDGEKASKLDIEEWEILKSEMNELSSFSRKNMQWKEKMKDCSNFIELEEKTYRLGRLIGIRPLNTLFLELTEQDLREIEARERRNK